MPPGYKSCRGAAHFSFTIVLSFIGELGQLLKFNSRKDWVLIF